MTAAPSGPRTTVVAAALLATVAIGALTPAAALARKPKPNYSIFFYRHGVAPRGRFRARRACGTTVPHVGEGSSR